MRSDMVAEGSSKNDGAKQKAKDEKLKVSKKNKVFSIELHCRSQAGKPKENEVLKDEKRVIRNHKTL